MSVQLRSTYYICFSVLWRTRLNIYTAWRKSIENEEWSSRIITCMETGKLCVYIRDGDYVDYMMTYNIKGRVSYNAICFMDKYVDAQMAALFILYHAGIREIYTSIPAHNRKCICKKYVCAAVIANSMIHNVLCENCEQKIVHMWRAFVCDILTRVFHARGLTEQQIVTTIVDYTQYKTSRCTPP